MANIAIQSGLLPSWQPGAHHDPGMVCPVWHGIRWLGYSWSVVVEQGMVVMVAMLKAEVIVIAIVMHYDGDCDRIDGVTEFRGECH